MKTLTYRKSLHQVNINHLKNHHLLKRWMDIVFSFPLFILSIPIIGMAGLALQLLSPGPLFFIQDRIGHHGKVIRVFKLRTMHLNAENLLECHFAQNPQARSEWQRYFKLKHDPRIIPLIGSLLRKTSLDELPQFWNVLVGDMSLVGPRPFPQYHLDAFSNDFQWLRQQIKPGLTGLWQISSRSDGDLFVQERLDREYISQNSLMLDLKIILKTFYIVLAQKGAY